MQYTAVTNVRWANPEHSKVNCDVTFEGIGTHPFTASSTDHASAPHSVEIFADCLAGKYGPIAPYEPPALTIEDYKSAIERHLNTKVAERGYSSIHTAASYKDDPNAVYAAEGLAAFNWRSAVWIYAFAELEKVQTGQRTQPSVQGLLDELPALEW